jgi:threonine dehydratase
MSFEVAKATPASAKELTHHIWDLLDEIDDLNPEITPPAMHSMPSMRGKDMLVIDDTVNSSGTFKKRGATAAGILELRRNPDLRVLDTATRGSHGIGLAEAARELGLSADIRMCIEANQRKINKMRNLGATVLNQYQTFPDALHAAQSSADQYGHYFVHPYNQPEVIAGQGTLALDILDLLDKEDVDEPVEVFFPVGGGGLLAGNIAAFKKSADGRPIKVTGVEVESKENNVTLCEGTATSTGELPSLLINDPDNDVDIITVSSKQVAQAMFRLEGLLGKPIEGAGAIALAGALISKSKYLKLPVVTGANPSAENLKKAEELVFCGML